MTIVKWGVVDMNSYKTLLKWKIIKCEVESTVNADKSTSTSTVSAFAIMMVALRDMCHPRLPDKLEKDTMTRKEKLYNDAIGLLEKYGLSRNEKHAAKTNGVRLAKVLESNSFKC